MVGQAFKMLLGLTGCVLVGLGAFLIYGEAFSQLSPDQRLNISIVLGAFGVFVFTCAFWARARSLLGLGVVSFMSAAAIWAIVAGSFTVWQLIPIWIAAFMGVFGTLVYLIAFLRGKDAL